MTDSRNVLSVDKAAVILTLEIPDELAQALSAAFGPDLPRAALEAIALEAYRQRRLSTAQLRRILGYQTRMQTHAFLKKHCASLYDLADLEHDRHAGDALPL
jgi:hypothetical protein